MMVFAITKNQTIITNQIAITTQNWR